MERRRGGEGREWEGAGEGDERERQGVRRGDGERRNSIRGGWESCAGVRRRGKEWKRPRLSTKNEGRENCRRFKKKKGRQPNQVPFTKKHKSKIVGQNIWGGGGGKGSKNLVEWSRVGAKELSVVKACLIGGDYLDDRAQENARGFRTSQPTR